MTAPSDAFLSGEGISVPLGQVESELARLWGPAAELEGGADPDGPAVTRLVLANLVVADLGSDGARTRGLLESVSRHYPCRTIVLRRSEEAGRHVAAEVSAVCHLPAPGLPQVCAERIVLHAGSEGLGLLPGAVRPLLETDLPLVLWWAGDPRPARELFLDLADESARLILDQPDPGSETGALRTALDPTPNRYGRDLAWFGITSWREIVAAFFDAPGAADALGRLSSVRIEAATADESATPRVALWLAAWLAGRLGWTAGARRVEGGRVTGATFGRAGGPVEVTFATRLEPSVVLSHVSAVSLEAETGETYLAARGVGSDEVQVQASTPEHCALPRRVHVPEWDADRRLAAALESARDDPPYREALPHLFGLLGD